jgi:hypothetical protein
MSYDYRSVKVSKTVKRMSALMVKPQDRRSYFNMYVAILESESKTRSRGPKSSSSKSEE